MRKFIFILVIFLFTLSACHKTIPTINDDIASLPSVEKISLDNEETILAIRNRIDKLSLEELSEITTKNLQNFLLIEEKLLFLKEEQRKRDEIKAVEEKIDLLPNIDNFSLGDYDLYLSIINSFNNLSEEQKAQFNLEKLALINLYETKALNEIIPKYIQLEDDAYDELVIFLENLIPQTTKESIDLINEYVKENITLNITWSSSSIYINQFGEVKQPDYDKVVSLSASIKGLFLNKTLSIDIRVMGLLKANLPPIDGSKQLTFAYLRNPSVGTNLLERDYMKIDVINYAFGKIVNGKLSILALSNVNNVLKLRSKGVRVVIVIDGVETATREAFALAASTEERRQTLANSIYDIIEQYQFDGVDLDWEFPQGTTQKNNFSLLVKTIRQKLDESPRDLILSLAVVSGSYQSHYDLFELNKYIDYLHIMSYGMAGSYVARHQSPLIKSTYATYAINSSVNMYINGGIDRHKVTFGMPFYVKIGDLTNPAAPALGQVLTNPVSMGYSSFMANHFNQQNYIEYYDEAAMAYYAVSGSKFASYDNPASVKLKCAWAIENNLAGVMFWDYGHDQSGGTLLQAVYESFSNLN